MSLITLNRSRTLLVTGVALLALQLGTGCTQKSETTAPPASQESTPAAAAGGGSTSKGVGPVTEVKLEAVSADMATKGKAVFEAKCTACHKLDQRYVGPALGGITKRRTPEWVMNMILNPIEMTQKDPAAKELLGEYLTQMTFQNVSQDEARQLLEFFRQNDK